MTNDQKNEDVEMFRCPICGEFPRAVINTYNLNTWVLRHRDWCEEYCSCGPEDLTRWQLDECRLSTGISHFLKAKAFQRRTLSRIGEQNEPD